MLKINSDDKEELQLMARGPAYRPLLSLLDAMVTSSKEEVLRQSSSDEKSLSLAKSRLEGVEKLVFNLRSFLEDLKIKK